jgi:hypothetical protein
MELFLMMFARTLLLQAPAVIDWLKELKDEGKTEVTEADMANLMAKWEISAEDFFKTPPPSSPLPPR